MYIHACALPGRSPHLWIVCRPRTSCTMVISCCLWAWVDDGFITGDCSFKSIYFDPTAILQLYPPWIVSSIVPSIKPKPSSLAALTLLHLNGPQPSNSPTHTGDTRTPLSTSTKRQNGSVPAATLSNHPSCSHRIRSRGCPGKGASHGG